MRRLTTTLLAIALSATATVIPIDAHADDTDKAKWTIMVFMNGDNNLEKYAIQDFFEMASVGSTDDVNIVVQFDRSPHWTVVEGDWKQTLRFLVKKNMKPTVNNAVQDLGEVNMGDGSVLTNFVQWSQNKYPAERYALVIWDHGQGWRFDRATRPSPPNSAAKTNMLAIQRKLRLTALEKLGAKSDEFDWKQKVIPADYVSSGTIRYISSDDSSGDHLFNREIQDRMLTDIGLKKIDIIGFDACLMAMLETGYAMRDVADVMVASEELEPGAGWNYKFWIEPLVANPNLSAEQLGTELVKAFRKHYDPIDPETTLSAVRLGQLSSLAAAVSALADECEAKLSTQNTAIRAARDQCNVYAPGYGLNGIDLSRFCKQLSASSNDRVIKTKSRNVSQAVAAAVISNYAGAGRQGNFGSAGLAVYFPKRKALFDYDPDRQGYFESNTNFPVQFVRDHRWDNFLHAYFVLNP